MMRSPMSRKPRARAWWVSRSLKRGRTTCAPWWPHVVRPRFSERDTHHARARGLRDMGDRIIAGLGRYVTCLGRGERAHGEVKRRSRSLERQHILLLEALLLREGL